MFPFELQEDQSLQASFKLRYNDHLFFDSLYKIYFDRERSLNGKLTALLNPALLEAGFKVLSIEDVLYSERENFCLVQIEGPRYKMQETRLINDKVSFTTNDILFSITIEINKPEKDKNDKGEKVEVD